MSRKLKGRITFISQDVKRWMDWARQLEIDRDVWKAKARNYDIDRARLKAALEALYQITDAAKYPHAKRQAERAIKMSEQNKRLG